ncbi:hypothetical protein OR16_04152 [Cupriavidus basilensis OR16]|uniref:DUF2188 domain-containing protein n=1 Tax=Cupriavidus basilensis OR16 TaxID=1127483 RepID=H1RZS4_9BURK|nr:DUF2188 domain-containing protein [Cupriavidus basilensis]EHP44140.1 hypothetical protein OR16_04152 [Cupriavidus basilensis OR16]
MRRDLIICAVRAGWVLEVWGEAIAILEFDSHDEALSLGNTIATRHGINLIIEDAGGLRRRIQLPLPSVALPEGKCIMVRAP